MHYQSLETLQNLLASGEISSVELAEHFLSRIDEADGSLGTTINVTRELALRQASNADRRRARGENGALLGIPLLHKDLLCTLGELTTCGSRMLENFVAPYDATVVARLAAAGAVCLGKTNMDEFAMGSSCENSYFGPTRNPWDTDRVPGGSSGGSAAAVAAGLAPLATGTDTGGSIRQPSALCGTTGIKPTYGLVSRYGLVAFGSSLDQAGPIGRSAADAAYMLEAMAGFDARDSTSAEREPEPYSKTLERPLERLRIGVAPEHFAEGVSDDVVDCVRAAIRTLEDAGATVQDISLPNAGLAVPVYYIVAPAECASNLSRFDGVRYGHRASEVSDLFDLYCRSRAEGFGPEVKRRIMVGTFALSAGYYDAYYLKAQKLRRLIADDFRRAFEQVDVIAGPTSPTVAFPLGDKTSDPLSMYACDVNTCSVNLAGLPALSAPAGFIDGLPVGLQLIGNYFGEGTLLATAHRYQQLTDWHTRVPPGHA
ncbi:MAG: Asp-tRNA(Asn)/Glu-tRNA(Gln) amidotransferase subunit GatA [Gammaproteobacteria bacterium]